jgi:hypothetical protein
MKGEIVRVLLAQLVHFRVLPKRLFLFYLENQSITNLITNIINTTLVQSILASSYSGACLKVLLLLLILL